MPGKKKTIPDAGKPVTLKILAEYLDLSPGTVSIVRNNSPVAKSIGRRPPSPSIQDAAKPLVTEAPCNK